jgi:Cof subfamily protein (haloacid dehalogenase superfamily)
MAYKLIAIDLDDTLLDDNLNIPERVRDAVKKAVDLGIYVVLCTGRIPKSTRKYYDALMLDTLMISTGGAEIYDANNKSVYSRTVDPALTKKLMQYADSNGLHFQVYLDGDLVFRETNKYAEAYELSCGLKGIVKGDLMEMETVVTPKVLFISDVERMDDIQARAEAEFPMLSIKRSKPTYVEFSSPDVSKGDALKFVAEYYGVKSEDVIAVGDAEIDIPMLEFAGLGVAMANATPITKQAADALCPSNNEGGVADVIQKYILEAQNENQAQN